MSKNINFRRWLQLYEALDPSVRASLEKADLRKFPDRELLRKAIEEMDMETDVIPAPEAWKRLNALIGVGKDDEVVKKLSTISGQRDLDRFIQIWRAGRMSAVELYSLGFFASRGAQTNELDALARDMTSLPENWRKKINFSIAPEISTNDGVARFNDIGDFSSALHSLSSNPLSADKRLEFNPMTDIRPERRKDLVLQGGGVWIYKGSDPAMCRLYGKGGQSKESPHESPWCIAQTSNTHHYFQYRIERDMTFYFIFDTNKDANDPARRVLAGVSDSRYEEWGDMENKQKIKGYKNTNDYKEYLAGKLGISVDELNEKIQPETATDSERMLRKYLDDYAQAS